MWNRTNFGKRKIIYGVCFTYSCFRGFFLASLRMQRTHNPTSYEKRARYPSGRAGGGGGVSGPSQSPARQGRCSHFAGRPTWTQIDGGRHRPLHRRRRRLGQRGRWGRRRRRESNPGTVSGRFWPAVAQHPLPKELSVRWTRHDSPEAHSFNYRRSILHLISHIQADLVFWLGWD